MLLAPLLVVLAQAAGPKPIESLPPLVPDAQAVSPDHKRIAISTQDEGLWVLDIATKTVVGRVPRAPSPSVCIAWKPDASEFAVLREDGKLDLVDALTVTTRRTVQAHANQFWAWEIPPEVRYAAKGDVLVAAIGNRSAEVFTSGGESVAIITTSEDEQWSAFTLSSDGELLALGDTRGSVSLWKARSGERLPGEVTVPLGNAVFPGVWSLAFDSSARTIAIGGSECTVRLWTPGSTSPPRELSHCDVQVIGSLGIGCVQFSPDSKRLLATSCKYHELRVWDLASGDVVDRYDYAGGNFHPLRAWFTSDGKNIFSSLGGRIAPAVGTQSIPSSGPLGADRPMPGGPLAKYDWWKSDGELAWAVVDHHLVVRKIPDEQPVMRIPVREK